LFGACRWACNSSEHILVQRILDAVNSVGRPPCDNPSTVLVPVPLVSKHVVLQEETAGMRVQLFVMLQLHVQIQDVNSLSQLHQPYKTGKMRYKLLKNSMGSLTE